MSKNTDHLIALIQSLSKAEKRAFKINSSKYNASEEMLYIQLFDYISASKKYDEGELLKKYPKIKKSQLSNIKALLYKQVLSSLRLIRSKLKLDIQVRELIDFSEILADRGMNKASLEQLHKAKKKAIDIDNVILRYEVDQLERKLEENFITSESPDKIKLIINSSDALIQQLKTNNSLANFSNKLYAFYLKNGYPKNNTDLKEVELIYESYIPQHKDHQLGLYDKLYLNQALVLYYHLRQDFLNYYKFSYKGLELLKINRNLVNQNPILLIKAYNNCLNALYMANRIDKFETLLDDFIELRKDSTIFDKSTIALYTQYLLIHKTNKIFLLGSYENSFITCQQIISEYNSNKNFWDDSKKMVLFYKLGCVYFGADDYNNTIEFLNKVINTPVDNFRLDIHSFARILLLIAHFEEGNLKFVTHQIKTVYRFLLKYKDLNTVHKHILVFLRKTPKMHKSDLRKEFIELRQNLLLVQNNPLEKRTFLYLDIISWLDAKIMNEKISIVIRKKIQNK